MKHPDNIVMHLCLLSVAFFAMPCMAGQSGDESSQKSANLIQQSRDVLEQAAAADSGDYAAACKGYQNGADLMDSAIYATLGMTTDPDYNMDEVLENNEKLQAIVDVAKDSAREACALANQ